MCNVVLENITDYAYWTEVSNRYFINSVAHAICLI